MFPNTKKLNVSPPALLAKIESETLALGFDMPSVLETGALLRELAASKPGGDMLELGTGTGLATCWLLDGMDSGATLVSVDNDSMVQDIATTNLSKDSRLSIICEDGATFLSKCSVKYDLIFADAWPGKFSQLDEALALLKGGGIYVVDDLLPQENWPEGHAPKVPAFINAVSSREDLDVEYQEWSSGILIARKRNQLKHTDSARAAGV